MKFRKVRLLVVALTFLCEILLSCTQAVWYESHGIDQQDYYSEKSVKSYIFILTGNNFHDMRKVSRITRNMRIRNDFLAELLSQRSMEYNDDAFLINVTSHFINNRYYEFALATIQRGLCAYNVRTRLWFAKQACNIAQKTDSTKLLPLLRKMAVPGNDKRAVQAYVRRAVRIIDYTSYHAENRAIGDR